MAVLHGTKKDMTLAVCCAEPPDILVASYDGLPWLVKHNVVERTKRDVLVCDESTWIKDASTVRFKTLRKLLPQFVRKMILTGTPIPQGYEDLWSQMYVLDGGNALGQYITHYRNRYFQNVGFGYNDYQLIHGGADLINEKIKPLVFRGDAPEVRAKLPPIAYVQRTVQLDENLMRVYRRLEREFEATMSGHSFMPPTAAALSQKLRQICNGVALADEQHSERPRVHFHNEKIDALREIVNELNGNPLIVFYEFVADRDRICAEFGAPYIGGGVDSILAAKIVKEFNAGKHRVLVVHPQSGAFGLNLQEACHNVCWFGPTWNAGFWEQGNARVFRQGQTRPVVVHTIVAEATKDVKVAEVLEGKIRTQEALLEAVKG
jgi:SNF2 family DNA or RNA helicase